MRVAKLLTASCMLFLAGASTASAQFVDPFKVLEEARRDRLELDKRLAREAAERRQKEKADQAAKAAAQRKIGEQKSAALGVPSPVAPAEPARSSPTPAPVSEAATPPVTSSDAASATPAPDQPAALTAREGAAEASRSSALLEGAAIGSLASTSPIAAPPTQAGEPRSPSAAAGTADDAIGSPAPARLQPAPARDATGPTVAPPPRVLITVDKATQRMRVTVDGRLRHSWAVSTGRAPYKTPAGTFRPMRLAKEHYSREWDDAPMPYSIFFTSAGHAIHASTATHQLGRPASHGCVRLAPANAAALFALVRAEGPSATKVTITNGASAGKTARGRTADARAGVRGHQAPRIPADIWQVGSEAGWNE